MCSRSESIRLLVLVMTLTSLSFPQVTEAASSTLWQIGTFNDSSTEFHGNIDFKNALMDLVYVVGKSDSAKDWTAFQPASHDANWGARPHPLTIQFDLSEVPTGLYSMRIGLLVRTLRVPWLEVEVNGHRGWFYQHPKLTYASGAMDAGAMPTSAESTIRFQIPTNFLKRGVNRLVLTALDEASRVPETRSPTYRSYRYGESRLDYDALEMDYAPTGTYSSNEGHVDVVPTIFYRREGNELVELVDVFLRLGEVSKCRDVTLVLGNHRYSQKLQPGRDFGEYLLTVEVPEFSSQLPGELVLCDKTHLRHFQTEPVVPAKKWRVYIVPSSHLDIGYTDYQAKVAEIHARMLDDVIEAIHARPDFRFEPDGFWVVEQFWRSRSEEDKKRFLQLVKEKKIQLPAQYANLLTGSASLETLIRSLYPSHRFSSKYGGNFNYAAITDVPSYSWSYASILAAAGLKYFIAGSDGYRGPILYFGRLHEKSPFWWEGPDGNRVLTWYSRIYSQLEEIFGLPPQVQTGRDSLPLFLQNYPAQTYKPSSVILYGTQGDNVGFFPQQISVADEWNKEFAYPRIEFSGVQEAMEKIFAEAGSSIPVVRADGGPYWEDGVASDAFFTAMNRSNEERALSAEKLATISSLLNPLLKSESESFRELWRDAILYEEHTYGIQGLATSPDTEQHSRQQEIKESFAIGAKHLLEHLLLRAVAAIENYIPTEEGTLVIFNPLNWARSGLVEVDLDKGKELWDLSKNNAVRFEVLYSGQSFRRVRFLAPDIPPMGYKCYASRPASPDAQNPPTDFRTTIESDFYRVSLDPESGAVQSIFDKDLNQELVDVTSPYRFDQYLYVTGGDLRPNSLVDSRIDTSPPILEVHRARGGRLRSVTRTPFGTVARLESSDVNTPQIQTEIILFDSQKKIEFINRVNKDKIYAKEAVYFAFPFAMAHPNFSYAIQNGFVDPTKDQMPGAGKEWFSVQHWVSVEQADISATLVPADAPLVTFGDIVRGLWPREFGKRHGTVFSYALNNYWPTNYVGAQGGEFVFRYVLSSGRPMNRAALARFGSESMTPLEANKITTIDKVIDIPRPLSAAEGSFLSVDQPDVDVVTWKPAEDGNGTILRLLETDGKSNKVTIDTPLLNLESAWVSNAVEENQQPLDVSAHRVQANIGPFQILTMRLKGVPAMTAATSRGP